MKPVVPTTACTSCAADQRRFSRAALTTVKSTLTSAPASANASALSLITTSEPGTVSPAWCGSIAATSSQSAASSTVSHTVAPMRPPAPNTPTLIIPAG